MIEITVTPNGFNVLNLEKHPIAGDNAIGFQCVDMSGMMVTTIIPNRYVDDVITALQSAKSGIDLPLKPRIELP